MLTALTSAAAQDYPELEILVVDALGINHPPLPDLRLRPGHSLRLVSTGKPLLRPHAANVGLEAALGEYFCILDDDDTYESHHVTTLSAAAIAHPEFLVVYGQTYVRNPDGSVQRMMGQPYNRALMYFGPLFHPQAALISARTLALGCRFDEAFEICSDRDFLAQVATHSDFYYVPVPVFNYRPDLGSSGTGQLGNRNIGRLIVFEGRLRAKWAGPLAFHNQRAGDGNRLAIASYASGDRRAAAAQFAQVLADYPEDPNALHGLARLALEAGDFESGLDQVRRALAINADAAEFQLTYAELLVAHGRVDEAVEAARLALSDPAFLLAAETLLGRYPAKASTPNGGPISRMAPCPCGSGRRFKHCHGAVAGGQVASTPKASHPLVASVRADIGCGELGRATARLEALRPGDLVNAEDARVAGSICSELGRHDLAIAFLSRSLELRDDPIVRQLLAQTCADHFHDLSDASMEAVRQSTAHTAGPPRDGQGDVLA